MYLISFTGAREILKISDFIEHYQEHKLENPNITMSSFIVIHYLSGSKKDKDYQEDMKLPFKTHDFSATSFTIQDLPKTFDFNFSKIFFFKKVERNFHYILNYTEGNTFSFYPPPKIV